MCTTLTTQLLHTFLGELNVTHNIYRICSGLSFEGIDNIKRQDIKIPYTEYDGKLFFFKDNSFDWLIIADLLHHTDDPLVLLSECFRVCKGKLIIKDHLCETGLQKIVFKFMDWAGNRGHNVHLPYNYLRRDQWETFFSELRVTVVEWNDEI